MRRRRFLSALSVSVGIAGCLNRPDSADTDGDETQDGPGSIATTTGMTPTGTSDPSGPVTSRTCHRFSDNADAISTDGDGTQDRSGSTATSTGTTPAGTSGPFVPVTFRACHRYSHNADTINVVTPERDQFAYVEPPTADEHPLDAFALELNDREFSPASIRDFGAYHNTPGVENVYSERDPNGLVPFDVPELDVSTVNLRADGIRYPIADGDRQTFATAPDLQLECVSVPRSVTEGEDIVLDVMVSNDGARTGLFLAGGRIEGYPVLVDVSVPAGETNTEPLTFDGEFLGSSDARIYFTYPDGREGLDVEIVAETETDTS